MRRVLTGTGVLAFGVLVGFAGPASAQEPAGKTVLWATTTTTVPDTTTTTMPAPVPETTTTTASEAAVVPETTTTTTTVAVLAAAVVAETATTAAAQPASLTAAPLLAAAATDKAALVAAALPQQDTRKCEDFRFQEDAQDFLDRDPSDPSRLDQGGIPGRACEKLPPRPAGSRGQTSPPPSTSSGRESDPNRFRAPPPRQMAQTGSDTFGLASFGAGLLVLGVTAVARGRRRTPA